MVSQPHPDAADSAIALNCAVLTVSDTRTPATDKSGQLAQERLGGAGHRIAEYQILPDEPEAIATLVQQWCERSPGQSPGQSQEGSSVDDAIVDVIILSGGTGIAPRDTTYEAIAALLQKTIPGFGELFRSLSYQEIGSRAMTSRAIAGIRHQTLIFSLPGSSNAVRLALDALILPEIRHLHRLINPNP